MQFIHLQKSFVLKFYFLLVIPLKLIQYIWEEEKQVANPG